MTLSTRPLHDDFGVEVLDLDLREATPDRLYPEIRALFEAHSLLLFREQIIDDARHRAIAALFGPRENITGEPDGDTAPIPQVSNRDGEGHVIADDDLRVRNLKSNFYWHTDSTFLSTPAISNVLTAYEVPSTGGETEIVSTRAGWRRMPGKLKARARDKVFIHRYAHSRSLVDDELASQDMFTRFPDVRWRALWTNPVNGAEALYIAAHACGVDGMSREGGLAFLGELTDAVTHPDMIYTHKWRAGDVLIWDQRATNHRGRPWPYDEPRRLASLVSSARESDGIASVRP